MRSTPRSPPGFAMAVTYPRAGNIGGGGFMVIHLAGRNEDIAIDYRETAPQAATRDMFLDAERQARSRQVAQLRACDRRARHGREALRWRWRNTAPASSRWRRSSSPRSSWRATASSSPTTTSDTLSDMYRRHVALAEFRARAFSHADGTPLREGDRLIQGDLAGVLTAIAEQGPRGFYEGAVAEKLVERRSRMPAASSR